jgi:hypothetical protein
MIRIGGGYDAFERIKETIQNIRYLTSLEDNDTAKFEKCEFAVPVSIVPLAIIGYTKSLRFNNIPDYFSVIKFPEGEEIGDDTSNKSTYFPITRADLTNISLNKQEQKIRELSDKYFSLLKRNIGKDKEFLDRIGSNVCALLISEMTDNINEHSNAKNAFIFSQYWRGNDSCAICLADDGIGFYKSLTKADKRVKDDLDAVKKVINDCLSAKGYLRGTGIRNTIKLLSNKELNGFFCVLSGKAGYFIDSKGREHFLNLQNINWNGTLIYMGFKKPQSKFNIYDYVH